MKCISVYRFCLIIVFVLILNTALAQTYDDVKSIFLAKCASCHNSKSKETPFSLESYKDIKARLSTIKIAVETNFMPPWLADAHFSDFANNRSLTSIEKQKILDWVKEGGKEGNSKATKNITYSKLQQRSPDLSLKINKPFVVKGNNKERFILFKVPFNLADSKNIDAVEFYSNNKKIVHHVNYMFCSVADNKIQIDQAPFYVDDSNNENGNYDAYETFKQNTVFYTGWIPGASMEKYPNDFGWVLPKRGVIIFTVHYSAIAASENSVIGVNLYFRKTPPKREVRFISLGSGGIGQEQIQPNFIVPPNKLSTFFLEIKTPDDQSIIALWPHMHYLGSKFASYAVTPAKDTINLIHIPKWNFNWQEMYRFKRPVKIPAGSSIFIAGEYDNTSNNPLNPNSPPAYVYSTGNMASNQEMLTLLLMYVSYKDGDENIDF